MYRYQITAYNQIRRVQATPALRVLKAHPQLTPPSPSFAPRSRIPSSKTPTNFAQADTALPHQYPNTSERLPKSQFAVLNTRSLGRSSKKAGTHKVQILRFGDQHIFTHMRVRMHRKYKSSNKRTHKWIILPSTQKCKKWTPNCGAPPRRILAR